MLPIRAPPRRLRGQSRVRLAPLLMARPMIETVSQMLPQMLKKLMKLAMGPERLSVCWMKSAPASK